MRRDSSIFSDNYDSVSYYRSSGELRSRWKSFKHYVHNKHHNTYCNRSPSNWCYTIAFYLLFTIIILLVFCLLLFGVRIYLRDCFDGPQLDKKDLMRGDQNPGLGFFPNIVPSRYPIIWYSYDKEEEMHEAHYIKDINKKLDEYRKAKPEDYAQCTDKNDPNKPCYFDIKTLGECADGNFGYSNNSLCLFLKMNRVNGWKPVKYDGRLPFEISDPLQKIIGSAEQQMVWVECSGEQQWDNQHIDKVSYFPQQGFPFQYFPYKGESRYLSPIVAVKFDGVNPGIMIHLKCSIWAKNTFMKYNSAFIKLFIDHPYW